MKNLPIGIQTLPEIINRNCVYVDKTQLVHLLVTTGKYYFLSRPRRFGKSLLVSTLKELFQANKTVFEGLWIENNWDWSKNNPVLHFAFDIYEYDAIGLENLLRLTLQQKANDFGVELTRTGIKGMFAELIHNIYKKHGQVVLLIDEYDKPIIDYLGESTEKALENQGILKGFYSVLKDADDYLRMVFITGVSKFSRVSIFSDLNNLMDLTINDAYAGVCGISQTELENNFKEELKLYDNDKIKSWYNGYSWDLKTKIYNLFSLLNFFQDNGKFRNYWFVTGTPTFLINLSKDKKLVNFENITISPTSLEAYRIDNIQLIPLMFQTGYLTIKDIDPETNIFTLDYPNQEVRSAFLENLANNYVQGSEEEQSVVLVLQISKALKEGNLEKVQQIINTLFKSIPYTIWQKENEHFYHAIIHLTFKLLGIYIDSEVQTSDGRMDALVRLEKYVYCFEFKLDSSAEKALEQIETKGYLTPYLHQGKTCIGIGVNFSREEKKVKEFVWREFLG